jgi:hypothetical protein
VQEERIAQEAHKSSRDRNGPHIGCGEHHASIICIEEVIIYTEEAIIYIEEVIICIEEATIVCS